MKKITLLLLLTLSVLGLQAQTTYQLNYDSIRVNKTAGTGGTSLYGKVYLKNTTTGLSSDSMLVYRGGRIYRILNNTGGILDSVNTRVKKVGDTMTGQLGISVSDATGLSITNNSATLPSASSRNNGAGAIHKFLNTTGGVSVINNNGLLQTTTGTSAQFLKADGTVDGSTYLTTTGSGAGLSGIAILNSGNTFSGTNTFEVPIRITRPNTSSSNTIDFRTGGSPEWYIGNYIGSGTPFEIVSYNSGLPITAISINSSTGAISAAGSISSTPQGTLYGTASGSITSAQLATSLTDETGTGSAVFGTSPTLTTSATIDAGTNNIKFGATSNYGYTSYNGSTSITGMVGVFGGASGDANNLYLQTPTGGSLDFRVDNLDALLVNSSGDLVIAGNNATKASGTAWINPSDKRLKENIQNYSKGLKELLLINPKIWNYNKASGVSDTATKHVSPIAQELAEVMPEMVGIYKGKLSGKETTLYNIDGSDYTMLLINAVKEQQAIIEDLKKRIVVLENK